MDSCKVVQTFEYYWRTKSYGVTIQMKALQQYFSFSTVCFSASCKVKFEVLVYVLTLARLVPRPYYSPFFFTEKAWENVVWGTGKIWTTSGIERVKTKPEFNY